MKIIFIGTLLLSSAFATMDADLVVPLQFNDSIDVDHELHKIQTPYLTVKQEEINYPTSARVNAHFQEALSLLEKVLNSDLFKKKVLAYVRPSNEANEFMKNYLWRDSSKRLSNAEVLEIIYNGDEKMIPGTKGEMNINTYFKSCKWPRSWFKWCRRVVGSTSPYNSKWIALNPRFYYRFDAPKMVNNLVHEWLHLLGFLHGKVNMREEVPYVVGRIAEEVAREL